MSPLIEVEVLAQELVSARQTVQPMERPTGLTEDVAAAVKRRAVEMMSDTGRHRVIGYEASMSHT